MIPPLWTSVADHFMRDKFAGTLISLLDEQAASGLSLARRIQNAVRGQIAAGALRMRERLPSSRTLAAELGIARDTVETAYQQLESEGFLTRVRGSGTFVTNSKSELLQGPAPSRTGRKAGMSVGARGNLALQFCGVRDPRIRPFGAAMPDIRAFPVSIWNRIAARVARTHSLQAFDYCDPQGHGPLREEIARYLAAHRGVRCSADNIIVLTSSQQALAMIASLMVDAGDTVAVEDPGYPGVKSALRMAGAELLPIPVDRAGLRADLLVRQRRPVRGVYVTPSHQYPTGATLSLERRLRLIDWARSRKAWIVEDDYDSEYRYEGSPISCIQGLDTSGCVLYVGTFTKTLFPGLRLAYLVVPSHLVRAFVTARTLLDGHSAYLHQAVLTEFMAAGHFTAHIRRMRQLYKGRRDAFLAAFHKHLGAFAEIESATGGFQVACYLHGATTEAASMAAAASVGIELPSLKSLYISQPGRSGWVMGYVALTPQEAEAGVRKLARSLNAGSACS